MTKTGISNGGYRKVSMHDVANLFHREMLKWNQNDHTCTLILAECIFIS